MVNYEFWQSINFFSSQIPLYLMLMVWFASSLKRTIVIEGIVFIQLIIGIIAYVELLHKIKKPISSEKLEKVTLKRANFDIVAAVYPILVPLISAVACREDYVRGLLATLFIQILIYFISLNSSDALYNYPLIIFGHIEIFEGDMNGMHYYCYVPLQKQTPNNVPINYECDIIARGWLVAVHDENEIKLEK